MSETYRTHNLHFFNHLLNIGILDDKLHEEICNRLADKEEKQILFQISNIFASFTASDWFELSCRIYNSWQGLPAQSQGGTPVSDSNQHFAQYPNSAREQGEYGINRKATNQDSVTDSYRSGERRNLTTGNVAKAEIRHWEPDQRQQNFYRDDPKFITPNKPNHNDQGNEKIRKSNEAALKTSNRSSLSDLKKSVSPKANQTKTPKGRNSPQRTVERLSGGSTDGDPHSRLYNDYFHKRANMELKREMKKKNELEGCSFVPQVNPIDNSNYALMKTLQIPVYDRLVQARQIPENILLERHEQRELKGLTFTPDISKSQKPSRSRQEQRSPPEYRVQEAVDRLYGDAQIKEKILLVKQMSKKEKEVEGCTFSPKVLSPQKNKENFIKNHLSKSIDRLYDENLRRHRKLLKKEVEVREQEMEECTFHPERSAKNYRSKDSDLNDLPAHDRLYERFKRKQQSVNNSLNELYDGSSRRTPHRKESRSQRSHSAAQEFTNRSPKGIESTEINTPAFDRLYKDMIKRKLKMEQLRERVNKEEGITFKPKTNQPKRGKRSESNRSHQDIKMTPLYESKFVDGAYLKNNPYSGRRESDNLISNGVGGNYERPSYGSNLGRR